MEPVRIISALLLVLPAEITLSNLSEANYQALICLLVGLIFIASGIIAKRQHRHFQQHGVPVRGIILSLQGSGDHRRCVVRFVTKDLRWITEEAPDDNYDEGEEVPVLYDPSNPSEFIIGSPNEDKPFFLFTVFGLLLIDYSIYTIFK